MTITKNLSIVKRQSDNSFVFINGDKQIFSVISNMDTNYSAIEHIYNMARVMGVSLRNTFENELLNLANDTIAVATETTTPAPELTDEEKLKEGISKLIPFLSEFQFEPNFRFLNSLSWALSKNTKTATNYILQYFELIDSPYCNELKEKIKSAEFKTILKNLSAQKPTKVVNNRFKLYYGSQGTGKTTIAMGETDNRVMVCNSSMLPADIMEDFVFVEGKATFQPSALWDCMVCGKSITLDEINLLPFGTLRFLQTILDGKKEFLYKGNRIEIADGFQIIGTMNLVVNGMTYGLPEPLVDRCAETRKFSLTADDLVSAIM